MGEEEAQLTVPFRNVGNGTAIVQSVAFALSATAVVAGSSSTPVVPPGQVVKAGLTLGSSRSGFSDVREVIERRANFSVVIVYADAGGQPGGAVRLDVQASRDDDGGPSSKWTVRQVHWDDTADGVRSSPRLSTDPALG